MTKVIETLPVYTKQNGKTQTESRPVAYAEFTDDGEIHITFQQIEASKRSDAIKHGLGIVAPPSRKGRYAK